MTTLHLWRPQPQPARQRVKPAAPAPQVDTAAEEAVLFLSGKSLGLKVKEARRLVELAREAAPRATTEQLVAAALRAWRK